MGWTEIFAGMMIAATSSFDGHKPSSSIEVNKSEEAASYAKIWMNHDSPLKTYCYQMKIDPSCSKVSYEIENDILHNYINKSGHVDKKTEEFYKDEIKAVMKILVYESQRKGEEPNFDISRLPEKLRKGDTALLLWAGCFTRKVVAPSMMKYLGIEPFENGYFVRNNIVKDNPNDFGNRLMIALCIMLPFLWMENMATKIISDPPLIVVIIMFLIMMATLVIPIVVLIKNPSGRYDKPKQKKYQKMKKLEEEKKAEELRKISEIKKSKELNGENADKSPLTDEFRYAIEYDKNKDEWENDVK